MTDEIIIFNSRDELLRQPISKIVFFEADGNYTNIIMANKLRGSVLMNLSGIERSLAIQLGQKGSIFMRIGKSLIVNTLFIYRINIIKQKLILSDCEHFAFELSVSKEALKKVKEIVLQTKK